MRKLASNHGSLKFAINLNIGKTPTVLGGREEQFGSITDMIVHWEGMENKEEEERGDGYGRGEEEEEIEQEYTRTFGEIWRGRRHAK